MSSLLQSLPTRNRSKQGAISPATNVYRASVGHLGMTGFPHTVNTAGFDRSIARNRPLPSENLTCYSHDMNEEKQTTADETLVGIARLLVEQVEEQLTNN